MIFGFKNKILIDNFLYLVRFFFSFFFVLCIFLIQCIMGCTLIEEARKGLVIFSHCCRMYAEDLKPDKSIGEHFMMGL